MNGEKKEEPDDAEPEQAGLRVVEKREIVDAQDQGQAEQQGAAEGQRKACRRFPEVRLEGLPSLAKSVGHGGSGRLPRFRRLPGSLRELSPRD
jgi:hypothetical protein